PFLFFPPRPSSDLFSSCSGPSRARHPFPTRRSSDLRLPGRRTRGPHLGTERGLGGEVRTGADARAHRRDRRSSTVDVGLRWGGGDRKSTRLNSSHVSISYAVFCLKKKNGKGLNYSQV